MAGHIHDTSIHMVLNNEDCIVDQTSHFVIITFVNGLSFDKMLSLHAHIHLLN